MRVCVTSSVLALGLMAAAGATAAEKPLSRAEVKAKVEQRLTQIEERQGQAQAQDPVGEAQLVLSRHYLDLAHRALNRSNERSAKDLADQAERSLAQVAPQTVQQ
jgi:hypothetical protein